MAVFRLDRTIALVLIGLIFGCAGSSPDQYKDLRMSAGESNVASVLKKVQRIIDIYLYEVVRFEESTVSIIWETRWKGRVPFDDERAQGIIEAQTRLFILSRPKSGGGGAAIYRVYITAQNMVRIEPNGEWLRVPNTKQYTAYVREIVYSLKTELDMTQRIF